MTKTAVILGAGPAEGLGAYLGVKAAREGINGWTLELDLLTHKENF